MNMLKVEGMHCQNCVKAVKEALEALPGAKGVEVNLEKGEVTWEDMGFDAHECCGKTQCCCGH